MEYDSGYGYGYDQLGGQSLEYDNQYMVWPKKQSVIYRNEPMENNTKKEIKKVEQFTVPLPKPDENNNVLMYFIIFLFVVLIMKIESISRQMNFIQMSLLKESTK